MGMAIITKLLIPESIRWGIIIKSPRFAAIIKMTEATPMESAIGTLNAIRPKTIKNRSPVIFLFSLREQDRFSETCKNMNDIAGRINDNPYSAENNTNIQKSAAYFQAANPHVNGKGNKSHTGI
jgi:hypothetical protein